MRFIAMAFVSLVALFGLAVPAQADTPNCVTRGEFSRVHFGDSRAEVRRVFDVRGHRGVIQPQGDRMRRYHACTGGAVWLEFERGDGLVQKIARF